MAGDGRVTDEMLVALADGELPAEEALRLEAAVAADPALAARLEALVAAGEAARRAYADVTAEPVPDRLVAAILAADASTPQGAASAPPKAANAPAGRWAGARAWPAIAASLVLGLGLGHLTAPLFERDAARLAALPPSVVAALTVGASGERVEAGAAPAVTVLSTHRLADGTICRAIDVAGTEPASALACREAGTWRLAALVGRAAAPGTAYRPASDLPPLLQEVLDARGAGPALGAAEEGALRARGW
jgi:anti-sigma factor RsiW